jgi:hypothetical protein
MIVFDLADKLRLALAEIVQLRRELAAEQTAHAEARYELEQERLQLKALDKAYQLKCDVCCLCKRSKENAD